jgi:hypothetical protein
MTLSVALRSSVVATALFGTGCVNFDGGAFQHVEREEKRFTVESAPEVTLKTFDGSIDIEAWDRPEVLVVVEKRGVDRAAVSTLRVESNQDGQRVRVEVRPDRFDGGLGFGDTRGARLIVSLPKNSKVDATSGDGRIAARDLSGGLTLRTEDGSIRVDDSAGEVDVQSGDGSIRIGGVFSRVRARSGDGSVTVRAAEGSHASADWSIMTGDGSVTLELPQGFGGELDAHTDDGRIIVHDIDIDGEAERTSRGTLRGRLGGGGARVRLDTEDGSIVLRRF